VHVWPQKGMRSEWQHGTPNVAHAVASALGRGREQYLNPNLALLDPVAARKLYNIRDAMSDGMVEAAYEITDKYRCCLVLLGGKTGRTPIHMDWSQAENVAARIARNTPNEDGPVAVWVLIAPWVVARVHDMLKSGAIVDIMQGDPTLGLEGRVLLGEGAVRHLQAVFGGNVVVLEQHHGDKVTVPPGWVHQVVTLQPCLKVALDVYVKDRYGAYALLMRRIASPLFGPGMFPDYIAMNAVMAAEVAYANL
jgi:JmjC domain, hydroxylase